MTRIIPYLWLVVSVFVMVMSFSRGYSRHSHHAHHAHHTSTFKELTKEKQLSSKPNYNKTMTTSPVSHCSDMSFPLKEHNVSKKILFTATVLSKNATNMAHWLFYMYQLGFSKIFILSNDCDDESFQRFLRSVNESYVPREFVVIVEDFRCVTTPIVQTKMYYWTNHCVQKKWKEEVSLKYNVQVRTAFIDTDEYITLRNGTKLGDLFALDSSNDDIILNRKFPQWLFVWRNFGTSGHYTHPKDATFITSYIMRVPLFCGDAHSPFLFPYQPGDIGGRRTSGSCKPFYLNKTVFAAKPYLTKPMCDADWYGQHHRRGTPHYCFGGMDIIEAKWKSIHELNIYEAWISHYVTRSKKHWFDKVSRGRLNYHPDFVYARDVDDLVDYYSEEIDLDTIESVNRMCRNVRDFGVNVKLSECCRLQMLGARGVAHSYPNRTKQALIEYCHEDVKKTKPLYQFSCNHLLGEYDRVLHLRKSETCNDLWRSTPRRVGMEPGMLLPTQRSSSTYRTCDGTCDELRNSALHHKDIFLATHADVNLTAFPVLPSMPL
jgi:hypothetical protein